MPRATRLIPALGAVLFALIALSACGGVPGDSVISIDGTPLKKSTFDHWMKVAVAGSATAASKAVVPDPPDYKACIAHLKATSPKPAKGAKPPTEASLKVSCEQQFKTLSQEVLSYLISSEWVLGEAASLGVKVPDKEVKARLVKLKSQQFAKPAEFEQFLARTGQTVSDLLLRVRVNLLSSKIQQKIIKDKSKVSESQITKYYHDNPSRFTVPEKRNLRIVLTKTEAAAKKAKAEVAAGAAFAEVAKRASIDKASRQAGGALLGVVKGQEEKSLDKAVFVAKPNVLEGPLKTTFGYYIFEVKKVLPGSKQSLAQAHASIKAQLAATGQQTALAGFVKNFKKKWTAKTDCRKEYVVMDCKQYVQPKTVKTKNLQIK